MPATRSARPPRTSATSQPELEKGGQTTDGKIHATDYITIQADAYRTSVANIAKMKVKMDMDHV